MDNIEVTGVQDGALSYVKRDGSGCGLTDEATFGNDRVRQAPDGGLYIEAVDDSGCGRVFPGDVEEYLRAAQSAVMSQLSQ